MSRCEFCGTEEMVIKQKTVVIGKGDDSFPLELETEYCPECEESFYTRESERILNKARSDYKRKQQGLLLSDEIRDFRKNVLGVKSYELSKMLGMSEKTISRYEGGFAVQSPQTDNQLRYFMFDVNTAIRYARYLGFNTKPLCEEKEYAIGLKLVDKISPYVSTNEDSYSHVVNFPKNVMNDFGKSWDTATSLGA